MADRAPGTQRARTAALLAVLLFTGARVTEVIKADLGDLGLDQGRRVLWVTRHDGLRHSLPLPAPAAARLDAYLPARGLRAGPAPPEEEAAAAPLFATSTGEAVRGRCVADGTPGG